MKYPVIISFILLLSTNTVFGQYLAEQEWAKLSTFIKSNDKTGFENFLKTRDFLKADEANEKYTFYNWTKTDGFYYGVRLNKKSGQVTYLTNDHGYVLKTLSRFITTYSLIKSEKKGANTTTHVFQSSTSTIAVKLDTSEDSGTHLLFAVDKS